VRSGFEFEDVVQARGIDENDAHRASGLKAPTALRLGNLYPAMVCRIKVQALYAKLKGQASCPYIADPTVHGEAVGTPPDYVVGENIMKSSPLKRHKYDRCFAWMSCWRKKLMPSAA